MNREPQFETAYLRARKAKKQTRAERKMRAMHDAFVKRREETEAVLVRLRNDLRLLDQTFEAELQNSPTKDPHHFAFPMTLRALITRRDNLKSTISMVLHELRKDDRTAAEPRTLRVTRFIQLQPPR